VIGFSRIIAAEILLGVRLNESLRIAGRSVKANVLPMVVLWGVAAALVVWYYRLPGGAAFWDPFGRWQDENGWVAAFLNRIVFCGIVPGAFMLTMKTLAVRRPLAAVVAQTLWSGVCGVVSGWMYSLHAVWLGEGTDLLTLSAKTILCQFVWTPLFFAPVGALVYFWIGRDFSLARCRADWSTRFWGETFLPNLLVNWIIWIPCAMLIHLFPTALQIQLTGCVNAFFCLVLLWIGRGRTSDRS